MMALINNFVMPNAADADFAAAAESGGSAVDAVVSLEVAAAAVASGTPPAAAAAAAGVEDSGVAIVAAIGGVITFIAAAGVIGMVMGQSEKCCIQFRNKTAFPLTLDKTYMQHGKLVDSPASDTIAAQTADGAYVATWHFSKDAGAWVGTMGCLHFAPVPNQLPVGVFIAWSVPIKGANMCAVSLNYTGTPEEFFNHYIEGFDERAKDESVRGAFKLNGGLNHQSGGDVTLTVELTQT